MRPSSDVLFATSNASKYREASAILAGLGIRAGRLRASLAEVQSDSLCVIASAKARDAFARCGRPVLAEDDGLFIDSLGGFPGPYSSYAYGTIGNRGILDLLRGGRSARFVSAVAYCDGRDSRTFRGSVAGSIARSPRGRGWGYDPIFVPRGSRATFAEAADKNSASHRAAALARFARWYLRGKLPGGRRTRPGRRAP